MQPLKLHEIKDFSSLTSEAAEAFLYQALVENLAVIEQDLIPDLSHISHFVCYIGGMTVDRIEFVRENRFRLCYSVPWEMNWSCAGQTESGVAQEKMHFTVSKDGCIQFLKVSMS